MLFHKEESTLLSEAVEVLFVLEESLVENGKVLPDKVQLAEMGDDQGTLPDWLPFSLLWQLTVTELSVLNNAS